jgi:hypothetical protein
MSRHSSPHTGNTSSKTAKIFSVILVLSLVLGLVLMRSTMAQTLPSLKLEPKYVAAKVGERFDVQVRVYGATYPNSEVYGWQIRMNWDPAALELYNSITYGDFMSAPRVGYWGTLLYDAPSGQKNVSVNLGSVFIIGQSVLIKDDVHSETNSIANILGTKLIMNTNLVNSYETAANAGCYPIPTLAPLSTISNTNGLATISVTTNGVNPGAQGDGLLATLSVYVQQDVTFVLNITNQFTVIKTTLGEVVGDTEGELEKQNCYKNWNEDINADGIVSGNDLFLLGKDFNKCPIQMRSPTATSSPGTAWTGPSNAYIPDYTLAASAASPAGKIQDYKTFGFPTTVWTGVTKVEVGLLARVASVGDPPVPGDDDIKIEVSNNGGSSFSATTWTVSPTTTAGYLFFLLDVTTAYSWNPTGVANLVVRITSVQVGGVMSTVYVDWLTVRVTPSPLSSNAYSDVNRNGIVNGADLTQLAPKFGQQYGP